MAVTPLPIDLAANERVVRLEDAHTLVGKVIHPSGMFVGEVSFDLASEQYSVTFADYRGPMGVMSGFWHHLIAVYS